MAGLLLLVFLAVGDLFCLCIVIQFSSMGSGKQSFGCGVVIHRGGDNSLRRFLSKREPFALIAFHIPLPGPRFLVGNFTPIHK